MEQLASFPVQFYIWFSLLILAGILTNYFNKEDPFYKKAIKYFGVVISTMPFIGIIQGLALKSKAQGYAQACLYQACAGGISFVLMKHVFKVIT